MAGGERDTEVVLSHRDVTYRLSLLDLDYVQRFMLAALDLLREVEDDREWDDIDAAAKRFRVLLDEQLSSVDG